MRIRKSRMAAATPKVAGARIRRSSMAFGGGGNRAFRDPQTMVAPDQAFGAAMAQPQGGAAPALPAMPMPLTPGQ